MKAMDVHYMHKDRHGGLKESRGMVKDIASSVDVNREAVLRAKPLTALGTLNRVGR